MHLVTNTAFRTWINYNNCIKLSSDTAAVRFTYEDITNFVSLTDFFKKQIESLPTTCKEKIPAITDDTSAVITAEPSLPGATISSIGICWLIMAVQSAAYYTLIVRTTNATNMYYGNVLSRFNIEWDTYEDLKNEYDTNVPVNIDKENDCK